MHVMQECFKPKFNLQIRKCVTDPFVICDTMKPHFTLNARFLLAEGILAICPLGGVIRARGCRNEIDVHVVN